ncbi:hypothetical protein ACFS07_20120 [Undibacterium arcticum]
MKKNSFSEQRILWTKMRLSGGREYQFLDPLSGREVRFPNKLHRDNFLVQFGEPDIVEILTEYPTVTVLVAGQTKTVIFDATIRYLGDIYVLQEVKPKAVLNSPINYYGLVRQLTAQKNFFAHAAQVKYELRTEADVYASPLLVEKQAPNAPNTDFASP